MKTVSITEFKQKCLAMLDAEEIKKQDLLITKRGHPVALVTIPNAFFKKKAPSLVGSVKINTAKLEEVTFEEYWPLK